MTRVLIVDDSRLSRELLARILTSDPDIRIEGMAASGEAALAFLSERRVDVVTMDIHMPKMDGFEATRRIMETQATPSVIVSASSTVMGAATACRALGAGAVAVEARPYGFGHPQFTQSAEKLVETVRLMAGVKVVKRWSRRGGETGLARPATPVFSRSEIRIVAIGASTGGPAALATILGALPKHLPFPVVVVQHICDGFTAGLGEWLAQTSGLPVQIASDGGFLRDGHVYLAPSGVHLEVAGHNRIVLDASPPENGVRPAVSRLFRSVASAFGKHAVGILLTGMGTDGAEALRLIRESGGVTIAQDEASSVVHGMPGEAIRLGAAIHVLPPESIGVFLRHLGGQ